MHNKATYLSASSGTSSAVGESANGDGEREGKGAKFFEDRKEKAHPHEQNGKRVLLLLLSSLQGDPVLIIQFYFFYSNHVEFIYNSNLLPYCHCSVVLFNDWLYHIFIYG